MAQENECKESRFKLCFTLKQHTPLIHFQSNQTGATLRATELKPKLDRFLIRYAFDDDFKKYKEYLIGYKHIKKEKKREPVKSDFDGKFAFDYKVRIVANGKETKLPNESLFFANTSVEGANKKETVKASEVKVSILSFNIQLKNIIEKHFCDFLLITNFGARSTKGYGSFTCNNEDKNIGKTFKKYFDVVFIVSGGTGIDWEQRVDNIHKKLKAGLNPRANRGTLYKSLLFRYMCDEKQGLRWEKRKIKQEFPNVINPNDKRPVDCTKIDDSKFRYARAMLGVASINDYRSSGQLVTISSEDLERFASPIVYKVIDNNIYLLGNKSYEKIFDKEFTFENNRNSFNIKTPKNGEFDLHEFLQYVEKVENLISEVK